MTAYYNEIDPYAAQWLRNLISAGHIADGIVDKRSIEDVHPNDLRGFKQCHFFAGIGVWSYALRRAGWPDDRSIWTGSCPCQPFSAAGKGAGFADERHLWPAFHHLIREHRPPVVVGEQVASKDAGPWIDLVQDDLEGMGYAFGAIPFPAAGVGAPHIRDRLYWVADADVMRSHRGGPARSRWRTQYPDRGAACELGNSECEGLAFGQRLYGVPGGACRADAGQAAERTSVHPCGVAYPECALRGCEAESASHYGPKAIRSADRAGGCGGASCRLADADGRDACPEGVQRGRQHGQQPQDSGAACIAHAGPTNGLWRDADWLLCRDGRLRPVEPGTQPLATGVANRVGRLRAYGNAICAQAAQAFIEAYLESI